MAKAELGVKRACLSCGMRFYDFNRSPILCPGCGAEFDPERNIKSRRGRAVSKASAANEKAVVDENISENDGSREIDETIIGDNDDDDIDFDDGDDVDVETDGPGIIQDDISDDDELLPNLDDDDS